MPVFIIWKKVEGLKVPPEDIGIIIEGLTWPQLPQHLPCFCVWYMHLTWLIQSLSVSHLKCSRKTSCSLSSTKCLPKFRILFGRLKHSLDRLFIFCPFLLLLFLPFINWRASCFGSLTGFWGFLVLWVHIKVTSNIRNKLYYCYFRRVLIAELLIHIFLFS